MANDNVIPFSDSKERTKQEGLDHCRSALDALDKLKNDGKVHGIYAIIFREDGNASIVYGGNMPVAYLVYSLEVAKDDIMKNGL